MLEERISQFKGLFPAGAHTELRAQLNRSRGVVLVNGNLVNNARSDVSGVSARVYQYGVYGFASMAEMSDEAAKSVLKAASDNAGFLGRSAPRNLPMFGAQPAGSVGLTLKVADAEQKTYIDFARALDSYVEAHCPGLVSRQIVVKEDSMEKVLAVSDGTDSHSVVPRSYLYVVLCANDRDETPVECVAIECKLGSFGACFSDPAELYRKIDETYEELQKKREAVYPKAGLSTVVLGGDLCGMLAHEAVGHTVEADLVNGGSVAGPMLGKQVASPLVSLTDFAYEALGNPAPLPVYVDDEGTPATDAEIIKNGVLVGYMNNRETALKYGMKPNGNARGYLFSDEPLIRMRNTAILPGKSKLEDLIASVDDGYYLFRTNNGQADMTGEFMFGVNMGYEIKNGKLARPIKDTTITGVAFDMLKTVDMVSDHMTWSSSGFCGKKQPMAVSMGGPEIRCKVTIGGR